jgi:glyoxylase-like metal-dependent hydrolase (beta-lactamase superfamily II)
MNANAAFASAGDLAEQKARLVQLAPNAYGFVSDHDPNCGFVVGDEGVLVIDPRATPKMARELQEAISSVTDKPVRYIFLSHYHAVRVLGASAFAPPLIVTSRATLDLIRERGQADMDSEIGRFPRLFEGLEEIPGLTWPNVTFDSDLTLWLGGTEIRLLHLGRGHSAGDSVCWLPEQGVVFSGDLVENRCGVYMGDAYLQEWPRTLDKLRALGAHVMVPGRGAAMTSRKEISDAIASTQDFIAAILNAVRYALSQGGGLRECYDVAERQLTPVFGDWPIYTHVLAFDVARAYDELRGIEHPRIWTDARDQELWRTLHGAKGVPA